MIVHLFKILGFCLFTYGFLNISKIIFKIPSTLLVNRINKVLVKEKSEIDPITEQFNKFGVYLSKYIKINDIKRKEMIKKFDLLNIKKTPEEYIATIFAMCSFFLLLGLIFAPFTNNISVLVLFLISVIFYKFEIKKIDDKILEKKKNIDKEMFPFATSIEQELKINRDIIRIFSNYRKIAGTEFKRELDIAISDMQSGNIEKALLRMEKRNNSANLSEVIRGLLGVVNGDNNINYFQTLSFKFQEIALNLKREKAQKLPAKMFMPQTILFLAIISFILFAFALGMTSSMQSIA